jgi:hypothetical protein
MELAYSQYVELFEDARKNFIIKQNFMNTNPRPNDYH